MNGNKLAEYEAAKRNVMSVLQMRAFGPLDEDYISRLEELKKTGTAQDECPVCHAKFKVGDKLVAYGIQAWGNGGPSDRTVVAILIHEMCFFPFGGGD